MTLEEKIELTLHKVVCMVGHQRKEIVLREAAESLAETIRETIREQVKLHEEDSSFHGWKE